MIGYYKEICLMNLEQSDKTKGLIVQVSKFMEDYIWPAEEVYASQMNSFREGGNPWRVPPILEELKSKAKAQGLWNFFLPESQNGFGLTNLEYAPLAEILGKVGFASEVFNCSAPDSGNMEVLDKYGSKEQQDQWLLPLLDGKIRSAFAMTEPGVASSDATNICSSIVADGDDYVINGEKWWTSGFGNPNCKVMIFMGVTNPENPRYQRQSQILVPTDAEGIKLERMLTVYGVDHAPNGHAHLTFKDVRVPKENLILGEGRGFEIAQGRLGPGRIHHCMRTIGKAEVALELMVKRGGTREAFGKPIAKLGGNLEIISRARIEINAMRLSVLQAAKAMDVLGNKEARVYVSAVKAMVPEKACVIIDQAIQMHGAAGISQWTPLAGLYTDIRHLRFADGPDEVHHMVVGRAELQKYDLW